MKFCLNIFAILTLLVLANFAEAKTDIQNLNAAAETGDQKKFNAYLTKKNVSLESQDEVGMTPLMSAALGGQIVILKKIILSKVNLETKNKKSDTALAIAVANDQFEAARLLIESGANVDIVVAGSEVDTLFIRAAQNHTKTAELILKKNNSVLDKRNALGETALMKSIEFGNNSSVKMLLKAGADKKLKNKEGLSALDISKKTNNQEALKLLGP